MCFVELVAAGNYERAGAYLPAVGLVCDFDEGERAASARCSPVVIDVSLNDRLPFEDFPAPYRDEKLSEWRGFRANIAMVVLKVATRMQRVLCSLVEVRRFATGFADLHGGRRTRTW